MEKFMTYGVFRVYGVVMVKNVVIAQNIKIAHSHNTNYSSINYCVFGTIENSTSPEWATFGFYKWICKPDVIALIVLMIFSWVISVIVMIESTYDLFHRKTSTVTPFFANDGGKQKPGGLQFDSFCERDKIAKSASSSPRI